MILRKFFDKSAQHGRCGPIASKLATLQTLSFFMFLLQLLVMGLCLITLLAKPDETMPFLLQIGMVLLFSHGFDIFSHRFLEKNSHRVSPTGNTWEIGNYSEKAIRDLAKETIQSIPPGYRNLTINIADCRHTTAWTFLTLLWPSRLISKRISITSGSLYYLSPPELKAILMHEIAHHFPSNRINPFGTLLMADISLYCAIFLVTLDWLPFSFAIVCFCCIRALGIRMIFHYLGDVFREIEHRCDLFSASILGKAPIANALLKIGEEEELVEAVIALSARRLMGCDYLELSDMYCAFNEVRPYGRIFHDNLFKHAAEVVKKIREDFHDCRSTTPANAELRDYLLKRKELGKCRIRWRLFDRHRKGFLSQDELTELCEEMTRSPDKILVVSEDELSPTTHPGFQARIMAINHERYGEVTS